MTLSPLLLLFWYLPVLLVLGALALSGRYKVHTGWALAALVAYTIYAATGYATLPADYLTAPAESRWFSRSAQLLAGLAMVAALVALRRGKLSLAGIGLTLRQKAGSLPWALLGLGLLALIGALPGGISLGEHPDAVALAYHLTLPGIEEEIMYRGLLTALFAAAVEGPGSLGWGAALGTLVFALAHAFTPSPDGGIAFNLAMLALTLSAGAVLAFIRLRTGSLALPALGHNLLGLTLRYC